MRGRKEGTVLFNDALNTFYLRLYGVGHMVKCHTDSERGNPLPPHGLLFPINGKVFFNMRHPTDCIAHTTTFVTPVVEHWLEREIVQWVHHEGCWGERHRVLIGKHREPAIEDYRGYIYIYIFVCVCMDV